MLRRGHLRCRTFCRSHVLSSGKIDGMSKTPKKHFDEDIARASALLAHAGAMPATTDPERLMRDDVLRAAWMFAVGAMDAYFSDAYGDLVAAILIAHSRENTVKLPESVMAIEMPVAALLAPYKSRANWRWRVGARRMMDRENVLSTAKIQMLFNRFFRKDHKFYGDVVEGWVVAPGASDRLFGITGADYQLLTGKPKADALKHAKVSLVARLDKTISQRRHDCIHNCDRPKVKPQPIVEKSVGEVISDVTFFVGRCEAHITTEFGEWMRKEAGFSDPTVKGVSY